jgi:radical SAM superfamily enzyme YgiQ (UPF0313 family)
MKNVSIDSGNGKVLLVLPPLYHSGREPDYNPKEPMGLMYVASSLRQLEGVKVNIFDADIEARTIDETVDRIMGENAQITGFSVFQRALPSFELIVKRLRQKGYSGHITAGGITPTLSHGYILDRLSGKVDSLVLGEGELTARDLVKKVMAGADWRSIPGLGLIRDGKPSTNKCRESANLDNLPLPARDYADFCLDKTNYLTIMGSRGCYGACTFCSNFSFENFRSGPRWKPRNPKSVVDEIEEMHLKYGARVFKFNDPNIFGPGKEGIAHVRSISQEIAKRKLPVHLMGFCRGNDITYDPSIIKDLKSAGFERLLIGIESSDNEVLKKFRKGETIEGIERAMNLLDDAGISVVAGFMPFNPYTTIDTLRKDLDFLKRRRLSPTLGKALRVFDGTPIQAIMESEGRLIRRNPFEGYHEYVVPSDVASIYGAMKVLSVNCLDKIKAESQKTIWKKKKATSFRDRQDFNALSEETFDVESTLLENLVGVSVTGAHPSLIDSVTHVVYRKLQALCDSLSVDMQKTAMPKKEFSAEVQRIMQDRPFNTFPEQYRWNQD